MEFDRLLIVGVGLLGGSIGLAARRKGLSREILGVCRRQETGQLAVESGAIDRSLSDAQLAETCKEWAQPGSAQPRVMAVVCTPVQSIPDYVRQLADWLPETATITDVGSTKSSICEQLRDVPTFCGAHPLAGSDRSGVEHARADLFDQRMTVLTPDVDTNSQLLERTRCFWESLGSRTVCMPAQEHDRGLAHTSHLPHVVASALSASLPNDLSPLAATGWMDTTRVAAGNVDLWQQILCENSQPVAAALKQYVDSLQDWIRAIESDDADSLKQLLAAGKHKRDSLGS